MSSKLFYRAKIGGNLLAKVAMMLVSVVVAAVCLLNIYAVADGGKDWPVKVTATFLVWAAIYISCVCANFKTPYLFSNAYILALGLFHLSLIFQVALGIVIVPGWIGGEFAYWMEQAGWYVVLAMSCFGIGSAIGCFGSSTRVRTVEKMRQLHQESRKFGRRSSVGLLLASAMLFLLALQSYGNLFEYSRADLYALGGADSRGLGVFMMIFPGAVSLFLLSAKNKKQRRQSYALALFAFLFFMMTGYRSAALFPALIGVVLWVKTGRNIPKTIAVGLVVAVLMMISIAGIFRTMGSYGELGGAQLAEAYDQAKIGTSLSGLGQSVSILGHTLRLVPEKNEHFKGASYWRAIKGMFPNVGIGVDSSMSRETIGKLIKSDKRAFKLLSPSSWMTYHIQPFAFWRGGGVGYSGIAEPYLNFGITGILLFFPLLGYLLARLDSVDILSHPYLYVFAGSMLWPLIRTVRNDFSNFLKPLGFILIILFLWHVIIHLLELKRSANIMGHKGLHNGKS